MKCSECGTPLTGGLDTFGDIAHPVCAYCKTGLCDDCDDRIGDFWYGLAPHTHDLSITGSVIGSTVFVDLGQCKCVDGRYEIEPGLYFTPTNDEPGCGIWEYVIHS